MIAIRASALHEYPSAGKVAVGFVAGFIAVLLFHQPALALLTQLGVAEASTYSFKATAPFGVPQLISLAFWGGVWGVVFALVDRVFFRPPDGVSDPSTLHRVWFSRPATATRPAYSLVSMPYPRARAVADAFRGEGDAVVYVREPSSKITEPVRAVSRGQVAVFYDGDRVLGGARIC